MPALTAGASCCRSWQKPMGAPVAHATAPIASITRRDCARICHVCHPTPRPLHPPASWLPPLLRLLRIEINHSTREYPVSPTSPRPRGDPAPSPRPGSQRRQHDPHQSPYAYDHWSRRGLACRRPRLDARCSFAAPGFRQDDVGFWSRDRLLGPAGSLRGVAFAPGLEGGSTNFDVSEGCLCLVALDAVVPCDRFSAFLRARH